ncbi:MAG: flippase-like domain-containing protein [Anaerolineales bacterium]|nr:flippase-like domain-containing protein [Anaerolineales bacterium]
MRKLLFALVLLIGLVYLFSRLAEIENVLATLQRGKMRFILLALLAQAAWLVSAAAVLRAVYRNLGIEEHLGDLVMLIAAANFVNIITPSAGVGGVALFIGEARRKDYSAGQATVASALYILFDYLGFLCVLALGIIVLFRRDQLEVSEIIASILMLLLALLLATILYLGTRRGDRLERFLTWGVTRINRLIQTFRGKKRGPWLSHERATNFARDITSGLASFRTRPKDLIWPLLLALSGKTLLLTVMFLVFMAFQVPVSVGTIIAGFSVAFLFTIISPTPSGLGFVEGALTLTLASFFIPLHESTVVAVAYRGITFWAMLLFGLFALRWISKRQTRPTS